MSLSSIHTSRFTDLLVLFISFLGFSFLTEINDIQLLAMESVLYVSVVFICLRLSKRIIFHYFHSTTRTASVLLGNSVGLMLGALTTSFIAKVLFISLHNFEVIILASIFAFFILGTLSPMVKSSHRDIIHH